MKTPYPLILGSQSPRRHQLLKAAGFSFEVVIRPVSEIPKRNILPRAVAVFISENKAKAYGDYAADHIVITADTIVATKGSILGKPKDENQAYEMLKSLAGKTHQVITGVTIFHKGKFNSFSEVTNVTFRSLSDSEIKYYIDQYKPYDKAGAYGIQEWIGMIGISSIEGCYYNVMGLPVSRLYEELKPLGISIV